LTKTEPSNGAYYVLRAAAFIIKFYLRPWFAFCSNQYEA